MMPSGSPLCSVRNHTDEIDHPSVKIQSFLYAGSFIHQGIQSTLFHPGINHLCITGLLDVLELPRVSLTPPESNISMSGV